MENKNNCYYWQCANRVGLLLLILFALCFAWYFIRPVEQDLHLRLFKLAFLRFNDMNTGGFILGAVQSYLWAYAGVGVWQLIGCCFKAGSRDGDKSCH